MLKTSTVIDILNGRLLKIALPAILIAGFAGMNLGCGGGSLPYNLPLDLPDGDVADAEVPILCTDQADPEAYCQQWAATNFGACVWATCDMATGDCVRDDNKLDGQDCDDNDLCTDSGTCQDGQCVGSDPVDPDDGFACTVDTCDPATGIVNTPDDTLCDDGDPCTGIETCDPIADTADPVTGCVTSPPSDEDTTCDGVDDDCDGDTDEDYVSDDTCGVGYCLTNNTPSVCVDGQETACQPGAPNSADDPCPADGIDDDCDGLTDEDCAGGEPVTGAEVIFTSTLGLDTRIVTEPSGDPGFYDSQLVDITNPNQGGTTNASVNGNVAPNPLPWQIKAGTAAQVELVTSRDTVYEDDSDLTAYAYVTDAIGSPVDPFTNVEFQWDIAGALVKATGASLGNGLFTATLTPPTAAFAGATGTIVANSGVVSPTVAADAMDTPPGTGFVQVGEVGIELPLGPRFDNSQFDVPVFVNTGANVVGAYNLTINFDTAMLEALAVSSPLAHLTPVFNIDNNAGTISFNATNTDPGTGQPTGAKAQVATLTFRVKNGTPAGTTGQVSGQAVDLLNTTGTGLDFLTNSVVQVFDGFGLGTSGLVEVKNVELRGIFARALDNTLLNWSVLTGTLPTTTIEVTEVFSDGSTDMARDPVAATCASGDTNVATTQDCTVTGAGAGTTDITASADGFDASAMIYVLDPTFDVSLDDDALGLITDLGVLQGTQAVVEATFSDGFLYSFTLDVTDDVTFDTGDSAVVTVDGATGKVTAVADGTTDVQALGMGAALLGAKSVTVDSTDEITVTGLHVIVPAWIRMVWVQPDQVPDADGLLADRAQVRNVFTKEGQQVQSSVYVVFSDDEITNGGSRIDVTGEQGTTFASSDEGIGTVDDSGVVAAVSGGNANLEVTWLSEGGFTIDGVGPYVVELFDATGVDATIGDDQLAINDVDLAATLKGLPTVTNITVEITFEDNSTKDFTEDSRTIYTVTTGATLVTVTNFADCVGVLGCVPGTVTSTGNGFGPVEIEVTFDGEYLAGLSDTVQLEVVAWDVIHLQSWEMYTPDGSNPVVEDTLSFIEGTSEWQRSMLQVWHSFTDGSIIDRTAQAGYGVLDGNVLQVVQNGTVQARAVGPGATEIDATDSGKTTDPLTITVDTVEQDVVGLYPDFLAGVPCGMDRPLHGIKDVSTAQLDVYGQYDDGTRNWLTPGLGPVNGTKPNAAWVVPGLLDFTAANNAPFGTYAAFTTVGATTGLATIHGNGPATATVDVATAADTGSAFDPPAPLGLLVNLTPAVGDVDMGDVNCLPFPDRTADEYFEMPVRVNTGAQSLGGLDIQITFDPDVLEVTPDTGPEVVQGSGVMGNTTVFSANPYAAPGTILLNLVMANGAAVSGDGIEVARIRFKALKSGDSISDMAGVIIGLNDEAIQPIPTGGTVPRDFVAGAGPLDPYPGGVWGDADDNNEYQLEDVQFVQNSLAGLFIPNPTQQAQSDIFPDGSVNTRDTFYGSLVLARLSHFVDGDAVDTPTGPGQVQLRATLIDRDQNPVTGNVQVRFELKTVNNAATIDFTNGVTPTAFGSVETVAYHAGNGVWVTDVTGLQVDETGIQVVVLLDVPQGAGVKTTAFLDSQTLINPETGLPDPLATYRPLFTFDYSDVLDCSQVTFGDMVAVNDVALGTSGHPGQGLNVNMAPGCAPQGNCSMDIDNQASLLAPLANPAIAAELEAVTWGTAMMDFINYQADGVPFKLPVYAGMLDPANAGCDFKNQSCDFLVPFYNFDLQCEPLYFFSNAEVNAGKLTAGGPGHDFNVTVDYNGQPVSGTIHDAQLDATVVTDIGGAIIGLTNTSIIAGAVVPADLLTVFDVVFPGDGNTVVYNHPQLGPINKDFVVQQIQNIAPDYDTDGDTIADAVSIGAVFTALAVGDTVALDATCDGVDDDGDGQTDEDYVPTTTNCGLGVCAATGQLVCLNGVPTDNCAEGPQLSPTDATCDLVDDNCNGTPDEDYAPDATCGVGYCQTTNTPSTCVNGIESACQEGTQNSADDPCPADGVDDNCNGQTDEDCVVLGAPVTGADVIFTSTLGDDSMIVVEPASEPGFYDSEILDLTNPNLSGSSTASVSGNFAPNPPGYNTLAMAPAAVQLVLERNQIHEGDATFRAFAYVTDGLGSPVDPSTPVTFTVTGLPAPIIASGGWINEGLFLTDLTIPGSYFVTGGIGTVTASAGGIDSFGETIAVVQQTAQLVLQAGEVGVEIPKHPIIDGTTFNVPVYVNSGANVIGSYDLRFDFNPTQLEVTSVFGAQANLVPVVNIDNGTGFVSFNASNNDPLSGQPSGPMVQLATIEFGLKNGVTAGTAAAIAGTVLELRNTVGSQGLSILTNPDVLARDFDGPGTGGVVIARNHGLQGIFASMDDNSLLNRFVIDGTKPSSDVAVIGVYNDGQWSDIRNQPGTTCSSGQPAVVSTSLVGCTVTGEGSGIAQIQAAAAGFQTSTVVYVLDPTFNAMVGDDNLENIPELNMLQSTQAEVHATFTVGTFDFTYDVTGDLTYGSTNPGVFTVVPATGQIAGVGTGTANLQAFGFGGTPLGLALVNVDAASAVTVTGIHAIVPAWIQMTWVQPDQILDAQAKTDVRAQVRNLFEKEGQQVQSSAFLILSDDQTTDGGSRIDITADPGTSYASSSAAVGTVDGNGLVTAVSGGDANVEVTYTHNGFTTNGVGPFVVDLVDPSSATANIQHPQIAKDAADLAATLKGLPTQTNISVQVTFQDNSTTDFTLDSRTKYEVILGGGLVTVEDFTSCTGVPGCVPGTVTTTGVGPGTVTIKVSFDGGYLAGIETTVQVEVVAWESIQLDSWELFTPINTNPMVEDTLSFIEGTGEWQRSVLQVWHTFSDGTTIDRTALAQYGVLDPNVLQVVVGGTVQVRAIGPGVTAVDALDSGKTSAPYTITVDTVQQDVTFLGIDHFSGAACPGGARTLHGFLNQIDQLDAWCEYADGTRNWLTPGLGVADFSKPNANYQVPGLLAFAAVNDAPYGTYSAFTTVDASTGAATALGNGPATVTLDVAPDTGAPFGAPSVLSLAVNLLPEAGDVDLGDITCLAFPDRNGGEFFAMPVRVNTDGQNLGGLDTQITYDTNVLEVIDVAQGSNVVGQVGTYDANWQLTPGVIYLNMTGLVGSSINGPGVEVAVITFQARATKNGGTAISDMGGTVLTFVDDALGTPLPIGAATPRPFTAGAGPLDPATTGVWGDANADNDFTVTDIMFIQQYVAGLIPGNVADLDVFPEGTVSVGDAFYSSQVLSRLSNFVAGEAVDLASGPATIQLRASVFDRDQLPVTSQLTVRFEVKSVNNAGTIDFTNGATPTGFGTVVTEAVHAGGGVYTTDVSGLDVAETGIEVVVLLDVLDPQGGLIKTSEFLGSALIPGGTFNPLFTFDTLPALDCCQQVTFGDVVAINDVRLGLNGQVGQGLNVDGNLTTCAPGGNCALGIDNQASGILTVYDVNQAIVDNLANVDFGTGLVDFKNYQAEGVPFVLPLYVGVERNDGGCDFLTQSCSFYVPYYNFDAQCEPLYTFTNAVINGGVLSAGGPDYDFTVDTWYQGSPITGTVHDVQVQATVEFDAEERVIGISAGSLVGGALKSSDLFLALDFVVPGDGTTVVYTDPVFGPITKDMVLTWLQGILLPDVDTDGDSTADAVSIGGIVSALSATVLGCSDACETGADCNDNNPCTDDICEWDTSCRNPYNTIPCDDGLAYTINDACNMGVCQGQMVNCSQVVTFGDLVAISDVVLGDSGHPGQGLDVDGSPLTCKPDGNCSAGINNEASLLAALVNPVLAQELAVATWGSALLDFQNFVADGAAFTLPVYAGALDPANAGCDFTVDNCDFDIRDYNFDPQCDPLYFFDNAVINGTSLTAGGPGYDLTVAVEVAGQVVTGTIYGAQLNATLVISPLGHIIGLTDTSIIAGAVRIDDLLALFDTLVPGDGSTVVYDHPSLGPVDKDTVRSLIQNTLIADIDTDGDTVADAVSIGTLIKAMAANTHPCAIIGCDDGNVCTDDVCDLQNGCQYTNNTDPCDDGIPWTDNDTCNAGVCAGTLVDCSQIVDFGDVVAVNDARLGLNGHPGQGLDVDGDPLTCKPDGNCSFGINNQTSGILPLFDVNQTIVDNLGQASWGTALLDFKNYMTPGAQFQLPMYLGAEQTDGQGCDFKTQSCNFWVPYYNFDAQCQALYTFDNAVISGGVLTAGGPGYNFTFDTWYLGTPVTGTLYNVQIEAPVQFDGTGHIVGLDWGSIIGGAIRSTEVTFLLDLLVPGPGSTVLYTDPTIGDITKDQVLVWMQSILLPDVDTNGDTIPDAFSFGALYSALQANVLGVSPPCKTAADCDDGNPCTTDICEWDESCRYMYNMNPCDDGLPYTINDICNMGVCEGQTQDCCQVVTFGDTVAINNVRLGINGHPGEGLDVDGNPATCKPDGDCSAGIDNLASILATIVNPVLADELAAANWGSAILDFKNYLMDGQAFDLPIYAGALDPNNVGCDFKTQSCDFIVPFYNFDGDCNPMYFFNNAVINGTTLTAGGPGTDIAAAIFFAGQALNGTIYDVQIAGTLVKDGTDAVIGLTDVSIIGGAIRVDDLLAVFDVVFPGDGTTVVYNHPSLGDVTKDDVRTFISGMSADIDGDKVSIGAVFTALSSDVTGCGPACDTVVDCDDGNMCTDEACSPFTGCTYTYNANPCDDGLPYTINDVCNLGVCAGTGVPPQDCSQVVSFGDLVAVNDARLGLNGHPGQGLNVDYKLATCAPGGNCSAGIDNQASAILSLYDVNQLIADNLDLVQLTTIMADFKNYQADGVPFELPMYLGVAQSGSPACDFKTQSCDFFVPYYNFDDQCRPLYAFTNAVINNGVLTAGGPGTDFTVDTNYEGDPVSGTVYDVQVRADVEFDGMGHVSGISAGSLVAGAVLASNLVSALNLAVPGDDSTVIYTDPLFGDITKGLVMQWIQNILVPDIDTSGDGNPDAVSIGAVMSALSAGVIGYGKECQTPADCDDGNPCTYNFCAFDYSCRFQYTSDPCDDGDSNTVNDTCFMGLCIGDILDCSQVVTFGDLVAVNDARLGLNGHPGEGLDVDGNPATCKPDGDCSAGIDNQASAILPLYDVNQTIADNLDLVQLTTILADFKNYQVDGVPFMLPMYMGVGVSGPPDCDFKTQSCNFFVPFYNFDANCDPHYGFTNAVISGGVLTAGGPGYDITIDTWYQGNPISGTVYDVQIEAVVEFDPMGHVSGISSGSILAGAVKSSNLVSALNLAVPGDDSTIVYSDPVFGDVTKGQVLQWLQNILVPDIDTDGDGTPDAVSIGVIASALQAGVIGYGKECQTPADCDDGDPCTYDFCANDNSCRFQYNSDPCDDRIDETVNDTCVLGQCIGEYLDCGTIVEIGDLVAINDGSLGLNGHPGQGLDVDGNPATCKPDGDCSAGIDNQTSAILTVYDVNQVIQDNNSLLDWGSLLIDFVNIQTDGTPFVLPIYLGRVSDTNPGCDYQTQSCDFTLAHINWDGQCQPRYFFDNAVINGNVLTAGGPGTDISVSLEYDGTLYSGTVYDVQVQATIEFDGMGHVTGISAGSIVGGAVLASNLVSALNLAVPGDDSTIIYSDPVFGDVTKGQVLQWLQNILVPDSDTDGDGNPDAVSIGLLTSALAAGLANIGSACDTNADCNDSNPCTNDICNPFVGCTYSYTTAPCDDRDVNTVNDVCINGVCVGDVLDCGLVATFGDVVTLSNVKLGTSGVPGQGLDVDTNPASCSPTADPFCSDGIDNKASVLHNIAEALVPGFDINAEVNDLMTDQDDGTLLADFKNFHAYGVPFELPLYVGRVAASTAGCQPATETCDFELPQFNFDAQCEPRIFFDDAVIDANGTLTAGGSGTTFSVSGSYDGYSVNNLEVHDVQLEANLQIDAGHVVGFLYGSVAAGSFREADINDLMNQFIPGPGSTVIYEDLSIPLTITKDMVLSYLAGMLAPDIDHDGVPPLDAISGGFPILAHRGNVVDVSKPCTTAADCNDNNPCTDDSCSTTTGCRFDYNTDQCDDGNALTDNDTCVLGQCIGEYLDCGTIVEIGDLVAINDGSLGLNGHPGQGLDVDGNPATCKPDGDCSAGIDNQTSAILTVYDVNQVIQDNNSLLDWGSLLIDFVNIQTDGTPFVLPIYLGRVSDTNPGCDYQTQSCDFTLAHINWDGQCQPRYFFDNAVINGNVLTAGGPGTDISVSLEYDGTLYSGTVYDVQVQATIEFDGMGHVTGISAGSIVGGAVLASNLVSALNLAVPGDDSTIIYSDPVFGDVTKGQVLQWLQNILVPDSDTDGDGNPDAVSIGLLTSALAAGLANIGSACDTNADCNDSNPCTNDICNPFVGCTYSYTTAPCDDRDVNTVNDVCINGVCVGDVLDCGLVATFGDVVTLSNVKLGTSGVPGQGLDVDTNPASCSPTADPFCSDGIDNKASVLHNIAEALVPGFDINAEVNDLMTDQDDGTLLADFKNFHAYGVPFELPLYVGRVAASTAGCQPATETCDFELPQFNFDAQCEPRIFFDDAVIDANGTLTAGGSGTTFSVSGSYDGYSVNNLEVHDVQLEANLQIDAGHVVGFLYGSVAAGSFREADINDLMNQFIPGPGSTVIYEDLSIPLTITKDMVLSYLAGMLAPDIDHDGVPPLDAISGGFPILAHRGNVVDVSKPCTTAADCNDNNPCTDDSCSTTTGCRFDYNTDQCDDGNALTDNDTCTMGQCVGTIADCDPYWQVGDLLRVDTLDLGTSGHPGQGLDVDGNAATCSPAGSCSVGIDNQVSALYDYPGVNLAQEIQNVMGALDSDSLVVDFRNLDSDGKAFTLYLYQGAKAVPGCDPDIQTCLWNLPRSNFDDLCNPLVGIDNAVVLNGAFTAGGPGTDVSVDVGPTGSKTTVTLYDFQVAGTLTYGSPILEFDGLFGAAVRSADLPGWLDAAIPGPGTTVVITNPITLTKDDILTIIQNFLPADIDTDGDGTVDAITMGGPISADDANAPQACGDTFCNPITENPCICPVDCPGLCDCGDGTCGAGEDECNCAADCKDLTAWTCDASWWNDGVCDCNCGIWESCDCVFGSCGGPGNCCDAVHGAGCDMTQIQTCVCASDPYCCNVEWDANCVANVETLGCGLCGPTPVCGDGSCTAGEDACGCPQDCWDSTGWTCAYSWFGDGTCDCNCGVADFCDCNPGECGFCGDGTCGAGENQCNCAADCWSPVGWFCDTVRWGDGICDCACGQVDACDCTLGGCGEVCGDGTCEFLEDANNCCEDCGNCAMMGCASVCQCDPSCCEAWTPDCQVQCNGTSCGDATCQPCEDATSCPFDCQDQCGNGLCQPGFGEDHCNCVADCWDSTGWTCDVSRWADGVCDCPGASGCTLPDLCDCGPGDCAIVCGDGYCDPTAEDTTNCVADCGSACGDGVCNGTEDSTTCCDDCPCPAGEYCCQDNCEVIPCYNAGTGETCTPGTEICISDQCNAPVTSCGGNINCAIDALNQTPQGDFMACLDLSNVDLVQLMVCILGACPDLTTNPDLDCVICAMDVTCATQYDACVGCLPDCTGKVCGNGGCDLVGNDHCGTCGAGESCLPNGTCSACTPDCTGKECGPDGCGGECGLPGCQTDWYCNATFACEKGCTAVMDCTGTCYTNWALDPLNFDLTGCLAACDADAAPEAVTYRDCIIGACPPPLSLTPACITTASTPPGGACSTQALACPDI